MHLVPPGHAGANTVLNLPRQSLIPSVIDTKECPSQLLRLSSTLSLPKQNDRKPFTLKDHKLCIELQERGPVLLSIAHVARS